MAFSPVWSCVRPLDDRGHYPPTCLPTGAVLPSLITLDLPALFWKYNALIPASAPLPRDAALMEDPFPYFLTEPHSLFLVRNVTFLYTVNVEKIFSLVCRETQFILRIVWTLGSSLSTDIMESSREWVITCPTLRQLLREPYQFVRLVFWLG